MTNSVLTREHIENVARFRQHPSAARLRPSPTSVQRLNLTNEPLLKIDRSRKSSDMQNFKVYHSFSWKIYNR